MNSSRLRAGEAIRLNHVDDLKAGLTIGVIAAHAAITYGVPASWFYQQDRGGTFGAVAGVPVGLGAAFFMGIFFLIAGALVPASLAAKGAGRFLRERWQRLGSAVLWYVVVVAPACTWLVATVAGPPESAEAIWRAQLTRLDAGPLWFAAVLLVLSSAVALGPRGIWQPTDCGPGALDGRTVIWCAVGVALLSFASRTVVRIDSFQPFAAHVWQWGQCAGLFALGVHVGRHGWLTELPSALRRRCGVAALLGLAGLLALIAVCRGDTPPLGGGATWQSAAVCGLEGVISTCAAIYSIDIFRDHRWGRAFSPTVRRSTYGAYVMQAPILVAVALLFRPLNLPPLLGFLTLTAVAVPSSFALAIAAQRARQTAAAGGGPA